MRQKLRSIAQRLYLPVICALCNQFHSQPLAVCRECMDLMSPLGPCCRYCAYPLPDTLFNVCGGCIKNPPYFDRALIAYSFTEPLRSLVHQFKYYKGLHLARFLAHLMLKAWEGEEDKPQCLIPVPMHPTRLRTKGFNHAVLLSKQLGHLLRIPYNLTHCRKLINTPPQAQLDSEARGNNLRGAFIASSLDYQHVAIVDDLLTTGNTANELARALKKAGVKQVDIWCCGRAL